MKSIRLTLEDIFEIPGARIYNPDNFKSVASVTIDSRRIKRNSLFVAIKGEKFDGHNFVIETVKKGISAVMINKKEYKNFDKLELPVITVNNTIKSYGDLAKTWRRKLNAKVIGITGSSGKTSTKELLASILSEKYKVNKTISNNNNHIGVPMTILSTNEKHDVLILELGTNHFGEIEYTAKIAEPDLALITNIGHSHLEFLKNKKGVLKEKIALFNTTIKNKGFLFINKDDQLLTDYAKNYKKRITYSFSKRADVKGKHVGIDDNGKEIIEIKYKNKKISGSFLYGKSSAENLLASSAVAFRLGVNKTQVLNGIQKFKSIDKRLSIKNYKNSVTLIDDSYNANPESMKNSIELLKNISKKRKRIAILGDMLELGNNAIKFHQNISGTLKKNNIDEVFLTGKLMKHLYSVLKKSEVDVKYFSNRKVLNEKLESYEFSKAAILVKGSRGMKMEEFIKTIKGKISG